MSDPIYPEDEGDYDEFEEWRAQPSVQFLETLQGKGGSDDEFDRVNTRISRMRDRLDRLEDRLSELRSNLRDIRYEIPDRDNNAIRDLERRQEALESVVEDHWDLIDEKAESLYDELSEVIASHFAAIDLHEDSLEEINARIDDIETDIDHEALRRRETIQELSARLEQLEQNVSSLGNQSDELAKRHEVDHEKLANQFQEILDDIQEHLSHLYERTDEQEKRFETFLEVMDQRLETALDQTVAEKELNNILRDAHKKAVTSANCQSCEESIDLTLLHEPQCPHCERLLSGIETDRFLWQKRHTLTTHRPGHEFTAESIAESNATALTESSPEDGADETDDNAVAIDDLDLVAESGSDSSAK